MHHGPTLRARFRGALLGAALGDALGRPFEGASARDLRASGAVEARAASDDALGYSDDTEMLLGVGESLLRRDGVDPEDLLRTLAARHEPARGYGHGTRRAFEALARGVPWQRAAFATWPEGSRGNGAVPRVAPVACRYHDDPQLLLSAAHASAAITHAHPAARTGCALFAAALAHALALPPDAPLDGLAFAAHLAATLPRDERAFAPKLARLSALLARAAPSSEAAADLGNGVAADESVPLALFAFARWAPDFAAVVLETVRCGGDTDTIGAMSGALAGALAGEEALPARWIARLENGPRGRDAIVALADGVFARWERGAR